MRRHTALSLVLLLVLFPGSITLASQTVTFEPVRAPSIGPENAPVTIIEIADFM